MKRFFPTKWSAILVVAFFFTLIGIGVSAVTHSAEYTLYWDDNDKNALKAIFDDGEKQSDIGDKMVVTAKGDLFGEGAIFGFDPDVNKQLNDKGGDINSDNYYAVTKVYCKGNALSLIAPTTEPYQEIDYTLGFHVNDWDNVEKDATYKLYAGITKVKEIGAEGQADKEVFAKGAETSTGFFNPTKLGQEGDHGGHGGNSKDHMSGACYDGLSKGTLGSLRNYYKLSAAEKAEAKQIVDDNAGAAGAGDGSGTNTNCAGGSMGWLFCPLINYMAKTIQIMAGIIDNLLVVRFLSSNSGGQNIEAVWRAMLSVANIMLVIAFMFIIFSQSTSLGLSNYGIKRMLPRLVIAAILMNLSFYICAIAIDFSNIIGGSAMGFLLGSGNTISSSVTAATGGASGSLLGGVAVGIAIVGVLFFFLTPVVLAIFAILVILIGRHVILLCLVLVSPLAFVAWLLPNTEKYFKKWYELFFQMLILYPLIMLMFGAALLLSNLLGAAGNDANLTGGG